MNFLDESKRCLAFVKCLRHFGECHANHESSVFLLVDSHQHTIANRSHVRYKFTNTKKLLKKLARIEASSICRQQFVNLFADRFCAVHTHQLEFTHAGLPTLVCSVKAALGFEALDLYLKESVILESELLESKFVIELEQNVGKEISTENCLWNSI